MSVTLSEIVTRTMKAAADRAGYGIHNIHPTVEFTFIDLPFPGRL